MECRMCYSNKYILSVTMAVISVAVIVGCIVGAAIVVSNDAAQNITRVRKLVMDTDAGADDAFAILMALVSEALGEGPTVVAITCVNGNTEVDNVAINVLKTLQIVNRLDIPVYKGAQRPLLLKYDDGDYFGKDGFGDFDYTNPPSTDLINETHAVDALIDLVKTNPGEITLLSIGPLTNIALAIRMYPSFLDDLQQLIIMGGAVKGQGNVRPGVEFNLGVDPAANYIVFNASETKPSILVPYETTQAADLPMEFRMSLNATENIKMWLLNSAESNILNPEDELWSCADAVAAAVALTSGEIVTKLNSYYVEAIFEGTLTRGMIVVDYSNTTNKAINMHVVEDVDVSTYKDLLIKYLT